MQKENPVIKNYIYLPEMRVLQENSRIMENTAVIYDDTIVKQFNKETHLIS